MMWLSQLLEVFSKPFQWWVTVAAWEQAVLVRLGKHTHHLKPGVHFRIPFFDRVCRVCVRERVVETENRTVSTKDGKALTMSLSLRYSIANAKRMIESVARPEETLRTLVQAEAARLVAATRSEDLSPERLQQSLTGSLDFSRWGLGTVTAYVVTFVYARPLRFFLAHEHGYGSMLDQALDEKPATSN